MLEMRNVLNKKMNKNGFTLAELLVVVAIIAILVAVSIPIFTGKLGEAKENTDLANVRAAKAAAISECLQNGGKNTELYGAIYYDAKNGKMVKVAPRPGYNKAQQGTVAPDHGVVKVEIKGGEDDPVVTASWIASM